MAEQEGPEYSYEHGRRYHNQEAGSYYLPNDEPEIARLGKQVLCCYAFFMEVLTL